MSPKLPRITARELVILLKKDGFLFVRSKVSHQTHITVPVHPGKNIGPGLLNVILKQAQISRDAI